MRQIYSSSHLTEVSFLKDLLERQDIPCVMKEQTSGFQAEGATGGFLAGGSTLWVQDADYDRALEVKNEFLPPGQQPNTV